MAHFPTKEADVQKVIRIARELGISVEDAAVTCDAFELAFSDDRMRRAIFEIIDQLDDEAYKKGEPFGLIINYTVELGLDGIRVGRYADEIPPGEVVTLTPTDRARILLRIKDNFPTQEFLGPIIMNRPEWEFENEDQCPAEQDDLISKVKLPSMDKEGWQPLWADGVVCSDESQIPNPSSKMERIPAESTRAVICLGPIRLTFSERFPIVSGAAPQSHPISGSTTHRVGAMSCLYLSPVTNHLSRSAASGLSPPFRAENLGHSKTERCPPGPRQ